MSLVVSFDCAETLMSVDWQPAELAVDSASALGLPGDGALYDRLLRSRWGEFRELNLSGNVGLADHFWRRLTEDWAASQGWSPDFVEPLLAEAHRRLYSDDSTVFRVFDDVVPCLEALQQAEVRLCVVSNWDVSLERTLNCFGLRHFFEAVVASMVVGVEKPDPAIFHIAAKAMGCPASSMVHIGDNPVDDLMGAKNAGAKGLVIDRRGGSDSKVFLSTLTALPERLGL
ncbi:MAG: HAD-IA family hydrolase [Fimbriimonadaceae bacterium]|nr:HAD-IA family hydrolase [Fimbriimonadaceae bacterium]QYK57596.1 MAG: HAD-IA family hydrolase [Fimbriimonadaceae bacterium]